MEQPMRCKTLTAIYKNEINTLKKLYEIDFLIHKSVRIHIEQFTVRKIEIDFTSEQLVDDLIAVLTKVERLLMLFDGYFITGNIYLSCTAGPGEFVRSINTVFQLSFAVYLTGGTAGIGL